MINNKNSFKIGQRVYLKQPGDRYREAKIINKINDLYTIQFTDTHGGIRVRASKLCTDQEIEKSKKEKTAEDNRRGKSYKPYW